MLSKSRKKRANELDDDYEYYMDENNENKCNINNDNQYIKKKFNIYNIIY